MKIKLKESRKPYVKNIIFHINSNKDSNIMTSKFVSTNHDTCLKDKAYPFSSYDNVDEMNIKKSLLINHSGFIPKNHSFKSGPFNKNNVNKPIKGVQCAN